MKKLALFTLFLSLAALLAAGYMLLGTRLQVTGQSVHRTACGEKREQFAQLMREARNRSLHGTVYRVPPEEAEAEEYSFYTYTIQLENRLPFEAEMVEIQLAPRTEDILMYSAMEEIRIGAWKTGAVSCVLLTEGQPTDVRSFTITYYYFGSPFQVKYAFQTDR